MLTLGNMMWQYKKARWIGRIPLEESAIPSYILLLATEIGSSPLETIHADPRMHAYFVEETIL